MGSGRVFPVAEELIRCEPFPVPDWWPQLGGIDFGWDHPSAGARLAWDRDSDCIYVIATHRAKVQTPMMFAAAVNGWGTTAGRRKEQADRKSRSKFPEPETADSSC